MNLDLRHISMQYATYEYGIWSQWPYWRTYNELWAFAIFDSDTDIHAPGCIISHANTYIEIHHVLLDHAHAAQKFCDTKTRYTIEASSQFDIVLVEDYPYALDWTKVVIMGAAEYAYNLLLADFMSKLPKVIFLKW